MNFLIAPDNQVCRKGAKPHREWFNKRRKSTHHKVVLLKKPRAESWHIYIEEINLFIRHN